MIIWLFVRSRGAGNGLPATTPDNGRRDTAQSNFRWLIENWLKLSEQ
ncbi:MAG: hypothetical protein ICV61_12335 [Microcoleus sp. Co-bin12]|nr:hypothetical protein [Microcoleus sp. Co-bin12]